VSENLERENDMPINVGKELAALQRLTTKELQGRYLKLFGETASTWNRNWLVKRIAWRLQALAEGDLSKRARKRAAELANDADLRMNPPRATSGAETVDATVRTVTAVLPDTTDRRLPPPGSTISREYRGGVVQVKVLDDGFEYAGEVYKTLSAVAKAITGSHCNGYAFFRIGKEVA
jgi:hypothetical protein